MPLLHGRLGSDRNPKMFGSGDRGGSGFEGYGGGDTGGDLDFDFDFDVSGGIENIPAQEIDFNKEAYYQSIVAPAEAARRDATTEAVQTGRAISAHTGRAPGDMESEILAGSIRQAGATSAAASQAAEEAGLEVEKIEQADLVRRTQASIAQGQLKFGAWQTKMKIQSDYKMLQTKLAADEKLLKMRLGFERGQAELNRRAAYDIEMFKINAGMEMLRFKEASANLRTAAGYEMSERESLRNQAYRMEYLDRMSKIQSMDTIRKWMDTFGRMRKFEGAKPEEAPGPGETAPGLPEPGVYDIPGAYEEEDDWRFGGGYSTGPNAEWRGAEAPYQPI